MLFRPDQKTTILTVAGLVALTGLVLRMLMFDPYDIMHPDELMQYLEQGNRLATGQGILPWEYRYGTRNELIPQLLMLPLWLGHWLAPGTLAGMLLARSCYMALCLGVLPGAWGLGRLTSPRHALVALFVAATWYESVLFGDALLSESLATALLLPAAALLLQDAPSPRSLWLAGLLLGIGVLARLQYGVFAAVLAVLALRLDGRRWGHLLVGASSAALLGALSDLASGHGPFRWVFINLWMNIGQNRAAGFGVSGPWEYLRLLLLHYGPAAVPVMAMSLFAGRRYRPLIVANIANVLVHSAIGHKEYRFIWLSCLCMLVLAALASVRLADAIARRRYGGNPATAMGVACLCAIWLSVSSLAQARTGGAHAMRWGGNLPRLAGAAASQAQACGMAVPDQWRGHVVPALLPRSVPLYILADDLATIPPELEAAANVMILPARMAPARDYVPQHCQTLFSTASCVYVRKGACTPAPYWTYQNVLTREGF